MIEGGKGVQKMVRRRWVQEATRGEAEKEKGAVQAEGTQQKSGNEHTQRE